MARSRTQRSNRGFGNLADLSQLLGKAKKGAAAEGALRYFGDELRRLEKEAADKIEGAWYTGKDRERDMATADWMAIRKLMKQFEKDIKAGDEAGKEVNG